MGHIHDRILLRHKNRMKSSHLQKHGWALRVLCCVESEKSNKAKPRLIDTKNRLMVTRGGGWGEDEMVKVV